ncbi:hypothetical protein NL108_014289 [Boleophthalmus pectinirostris]|nr:hypothetical protein NL108_014289 [Boleophthalmus pectinirostris]
MPPRRWFVPFLLLAVSVCSVDGPHLLGVIEENHTYCVETAKIPMDLVCDNSFSIGDESVAWVNRPHIEDVRKPFRFHGDERVMQVLQFVEFTHRSFCDLGDDKVMERIIHYRPVNCTKPVSALESAASA